MPAGNIMARMPPSTKPAGQPGMQAVQPGGLVVAEFARDQRIDARLHRAVAERQHERAPVQRPVAIGLQDEDEAEQWQAAANHSVILKPMRSMMSESSTMLMAKGQRPTPASSPFCVSGKIELHPPRVDRKRAQDEAKGRRDQRGETHRESLLGLG